MSICEIRGRISCARNFCEFREFRGRTSEGGVGMAGCHTLLRKLPQIARMCRFTQNLLAEKRLPQISQIYTETFSKKILCALRILWEFLYTNLECEICGKQPAHQPNKKRTHQGVQQSLLHQQSHQYKQKGVQRSPLHRPNNQYKTTKAEALTSAFALFSPSATTDADIRNDRRDIRRRNLRLPKNSNSPDQNR